MLWDNGLENGSPIYNFAVDDSRVIRVVAGPGAGKTFALQRRIMRLLEKDKIPPEKILVITYSKAAAEYLKNDILNIGIEGAEGIVAATLHGLCYNLISKNSNIAQARHLRILHQFEQKPMLYDLHMRYGTLQQKKERIRAFEAKLETGGSSEEWFAEVVLEWLENHNAMLFGEIITQTIRYLRENPFCPEMSKFSHVLVDEYQDLNKMEQTVVDLLSANGNLTVIGDGEQSIYGFKHAHPDGIRDFGETHKGCSDHEFWECRRCPKTVAEMAQHLMSHSGSRATKAVMPFEGNQAGEVETVVSETSQDEAKKIAGMIKAEIDSGQIGIEDVLVLVPMRNIADNLREELTALGISTKSFFKERVLKTDQQKKAFSMLNLLANPDDMVSLRFLLGQGGGECRAMNYEKLLEYANKNGLAVLDVLGKCARGELKIPYTIKLAKVYADVRRELDDLKAKVPSAPMELAGMLIEDAPENREFRELLGEAVSNTPYSDEAGFENWLNQVYVNFSKLISFPENIIHGDFVKIMSLHSSKGLSAKYLVIMHAVQGIMPKSPFGLKAEYQKHVEEKRRLFYVAVTRCKGSQEDYPGKLVISTIEGKESRFISELG